MGRQELKKLLKSILARGIKLILTRKEVSFLEEYEGKHVEKTLVMLMNK